MLRLFPGGTQPLLSFFVCAFPLKNNLKSNPGRPGFHDETKAFATERMDLIS